jgi:ferredoxin
MSTLILILIGLVILAGLGLFGLMSLREKQRRASRVAFASAVALSLPFFLAVLLPEPWQWGTLAVVATAGVIGMIAFLLPVGRVPPGPDEPRTRVDERDIMFARARLVPGSEDYQSYYEMRPEYQANDDRTRALPGLLSEGSTAFNPLVFSVTDSSFAFTETLREAVDGPVAAERQEREPREWTWFVKNLARYFGARTVGVADLKDYHVYTHIGRGSGTYGAPVNLDHPYAIAFTVEMAHEIMGTAPDAPVVMESARQYVEAAKIAVQLASFIRLQGCVARAHIDGNYRVIAPLIARDAGLGEIGRMGLLMTPELGPRVRLGIVTTDLPLIPDGRRDGAAMIDFCRICVKCAEVCPVRAIPFGDRTEIDGALRWRINADVCFRYWNVIGTDCGRCMALCPFSYPDSPMHNAVRWGVRHSGAARRAALWMDRFFYGAHAKSKPAPDWIPVRARSPQGGREVKQ